MTLSGGQRRLRVAVVGGGNGIFSILRGLGRRAEGSDPIELSAIIATADDGGSSGRLRRARGGLPQGDLRNALLALSSDGNAFSPLFSHRFDGAGELGGHALGNLILLALAERHGCYLRALEEAGRILGCAGRVIPATRGPVILRAETRAGQTLDGESDVGACREGIARVWLEPGAPEAFDEATRAIRDADLIVIGPGSLFTSLLPVLMVPALSAEVRAARGRRVLVANLMTQKGETVGMDLAGHLVALDAHLGPGMIDDVLVHRGAIEPERLEPYREEGAARVHPVMPTARPERLVAGDLLCSSGKIRHDPDRTASILVRLTVSEALNQSSARRTRIVGRP